MTQLQAAQKGHMTPEMEIVAREEELSPENLRSLVKEGRVVIPANLNHKGLHPFGIGSPLRIKVNANIGTSPQNTDLDMELAKIKVIESLGAEALMDLSIAGDLDKIRQAVIKSTSLMVGTVPIYQVLTERTDDVASISPEMILETIERHGKQGVDFITVHCGLKQEALPLLDKRVMGIVSRGGSFLAKWMTVRNEENPLYTHFDQLCDIARTYDMTLSLGDGLRPGAVHDATDAAQLHELKVLGELVLRARKAGVQVMVEGPGHVPMCDVQKNMELQQEWCHGAPFYVLGPLTIDSAPGYDHIVGAIGGAWAAYHGASFLCYVTPAEHLRLPGPSDVREGVIASKIAARSADMALGIPSALRREEEMSQKRHSFDWEGMFALAVDPVKPRLYREKSTHVSEEECSMCGEFCALKMHQQDK
ncbi:MAG TPA: phosphomethylpyrimidine synthase ThiC [Firmicutes bacterium]|nr:phosphomethylpyrimidine synthase ThiC [Bacillota bacterium]